ncbi:MAG: hypothetical protein ACK5JI_07320, partial [Azonexus sp.]
AMRAAEQTDEEQGEEAGGKHKSAGGSGYRSGFAGMRERQLHRSRLAGRRQHSATRNPPQITLE